MADIINFNGEVVSKDADADQTLEALKGHLEVFVLFGVDTDGNEVSVVTCAHLPEALWIAERGKKSLLERVDEK